MSTAVHLAVTVAAQGYQVLFGILAGVTAEFFVVDFKIRDRAARLASPAISA